MGKKKSLTQKLAKATEKLISAHKEIQELTKLSDTTDPHSPHIIRYWNHRTSEVLFVTEDMERSFLHEYFQDNGGQGERELEDFQRDIGVIFSVDPRIHSSIEHGCSRGQ